MFMKFSRNRRTVLKLCLVIIIFYIFVSFQSQPAKELVTPRIETIAQTTAPSPIPLYNIFINDRGDFVPKQTLKIQQLVTQPPPQAFLDLYNYLDHQETLKTYFRLTPTTSYHMTIADSGNSTTVDPATIKTWKQEQELIDKLTTKTTCSGTKLYLADKEEIRMAIDLAADEKQGYLIEYQRHWYTGYSQLIPKIHREFYITLAYQYKDFPSENVSLAFQKILFDWKSIPTNIELEPILISLYSDAITHSPVATIKQR